MNSKNKGNNLTKGDISISMNSREMNEQRYQDIGDWEVDDTNNSLFLNIFTANMNNRDYNFLVLLHELIECYLCFKRGITDEEVTAFDTGEGKNLVEAGMSQKAPYHYEHVFATKLEKLMAKELGVKWNTYGKAVDKTVKKYGKR